MTEHVETEAPTGGGNQLTDGIERVWSEIKQISKEIGTETRKSGRSARLHLEIRRLRRDEAGVHTRLGKAVYKAHLEHGADITLESVEGFAGGIAALETLRQQIAAKEAEIESLRPRPAAAPHEGPEEVA